ncbi:methyltransferase domain-containing protein [Amycolatopsis sp. NPDC004747]
MAESINPIDVGRSYDESSPISNTLNDGQVHMSYWYGEQDDTPLAEAAQRITRKVGATLGLRPGERLLDAGCGLGAPAILLAQETGAHVTGITVSGYEVAEGNRKIEAAGVGDRVRVELGDYSALSYPDGSFDAVLAIESLQCAPDLGKVLTELFRVLRPGGRISVADYTLEGAMDEGSAAEFAATIHINRPPRLAEWIDALTAAGFGVGEYTQCGPRVFGMPSKYLDSAEQARDRLAAKFGADIVPGLKEGLGYFLAPGPERIGYAIVSAHKPLA